MNAVLQALAHAPELLLAMDCEPHRLTCPVAKRQSKVATRKSARRDADSYCALCELEKYVEEAHNTSATKQPVAPTAFVNGFIEHVAPWFNLGVQEDSHEFLRLLIDAMQKSCSVRRMIKHTATGETLFGWW